MVILIYWTRFGPVGNGDVGNGDVGEGRELMDTYGTSQNVDKAVSTVYNTEEVGHVSFHRPSNFIMWLALGNTVK